MKTCCLAFLALVSLASAAIHPKTPPAPFTAREIQQGYRDHVVIAKPRAAWRASADTAEASEGLRVQRRWDLLGGVRLLELPAGESPARAIKRLMATGRYEYVQADSIRYATATPNDPDFSRQWAHANNGSNNGIAGADIKSTAAWDVRTDASNVIVAVIDSGVRYDHPDLADNMWRNTAEIPNNGIDDDRNGYIDDVHGINAIVGSGDPMDDLGHGTHVAGIIGAVGNNGVGIAGVAWRVRVMALKFLRGGSGANAGRGATSDGIECIEYAIRHGAHIINASYGAASGPVLQFDPAERDALVQARNAGIIVVAAAGNDGADMDLLAHYPASYRLENIVTVANGTARDDHALSTNFGSGSVELFAPGTDIHSTWHVSTELGLYASRSGTSMAAPHVAGALALLKAQFPGDTYRQLINRVLRNVDPIAGFATRVQTGGRLNLDRAIRSNDNRPFNDDFAARARLSGSNLIVRAVNTDATTETEPAIAGQAATGTLWWQWTPPSSGRVRVSTDGSSYDTLLGVFRGTTLESLTSVASNDNDGSQFTSRLEFDAQAGTTYQIVVGGKGGANGLTLLDIGAIPTNDNFASAETISGRSALIRAANAHATLEPGEPRIRNLTGGKSLWYRWTAPATARFQFALSCEGFDPILALYTGNSLNNLTLVDDSDDFDAENGGTSESTTAIVTVDAIQGTTYHLQVDGLAIGDTPPMNAPFVLTLNDSLWQGVTDDTITNAPTVGPDGSVYVGSGNGFFHAFNPDGTRKWPAIDVNQALIDTSAAALAPDGTIYFGSGQTAALNDSRLHAYNSATGAKKWDRIVGNGRDANNAVALGADGTIYIRSGDGQLVAFADNGTSATVKWSVPVPGISYASPVVGSDGTIYIGSDEGTSPSYLYAFNPNGTEKWRFITPSTNESVYTAPAIDREGNIYFGTLTSGRLFSLRPDGTQRWVYEGAQLGMSSSPALSADGGTVYFAGYDSKLHAVNTANGTARWTFTLGAEVRASSPAVDANGVIYIGCYDGLVYAINPDGTLKRTWATADIVRSSPAIHGTTFYIGSNDGRLYAFDIGAGPATSAWPQYRHNARRTGRAVTETFAILSAPQSQAAVLGLTFTMSVIASGEGTLTYQWFKDNVPIAGATSPSYHVPNVTEATAGTYTVTVTGPQGSLTSDPAVITVEPIRPGRLTNLSVRTNAGAAAETLIVGFVLNGASSKTMLVRAIGPSLTPFGVTEPLADPRLQLYSDSDVIVENDNWFSPASGTGEAVADVFSATGAFPLETSSLDAAIVRELSPGSYTAQITSANGTGIALAELYDTAPASGARLVNVSARARVGTGGAILIAGFTISGNVPKQVLIRGVGPTLAAEYKIAGALGDPQLELYRGDTRIDGNDDWNGDPDLVTAFGRVGAFPFANLFTFDSALLVTLPPGSYTAQVSGLGGLTGIALVEIYEMP